MANREIVTIVPFHKELTTGTLKGALELAEVSEIVFWEKSLDLTQVALSLIYLKPLC